MCLVVLLTAQNLDAVGHVECEIRAARRTRRGPGEDTKETPRCYPVQIQVHTYLICITSCTVGVWFTACTLGQPVPIPGISLTFLHLPVTACPFISLTSLPLPTRVLKDSTGLWEALPAVVMDAALSLHNDAFRQLLPRFRGYECHTVRVKVGAG